MAKFSSKEKIQAVR
ncbi:Protein of unknown function [Bacillus cytotoxicus]|nr:Protein of unknown function [Bacillus cytotoxicus]